MVATEPAGVAVAHGESPVRWWVFDGAVAPIDMADVPPAGAAFWEATYANDCEKGKRTSRRLDCQPAWAATLAWMRGQAAEWSARLGYAVEDDPTLHGGGFHVTEPGGYLSCHLDYDLSPVVPGKRRALNLIGFLNPEWREEWGGALCLCDPVGSVVQRFIPKPGRLVAFETNDLSYHMVEPVTRQRRCVYCGATGDTSGGACKVCWPGMMDGDLRPKYTADHPPERVTAAVYYLAEPGPWNTRQRAMFLPKRG